MTSGVPVISRATFLIALLAAAFCLFAFQARAAAPTPTAADPGMPNSIAVLGDSMSVATGINVIPSVTQPESSWSTGTNSSVNSLYQRILALNPGISGKNRNMAANGEDMTDAPAQANSTPTDTELVTVQLGGNNLCKDSVAQMTSVAEYRSKFVETLNILNNRMPNALIQIQSVPDIYNLWYLRGAPNPPNSQPSSRAGTARVFWDTLAVIPCKSLVLDPTDMSQAAIDRRNTVRQRDLDYNKVLAEECEARLRCRFDRYATFTFSSNRVDPFALEGPYLPRNTWQFVDDDISTVDHFHPGLSGQRKMAQAAWESGYQFTDSTMPTGSASISPTPPPSGTSYLPSTANLTWTDAAGIKGVQYRTHKDGNVSAWTTQLGTTSFPVNQPEINGANYSYLTQKTIAVGVSTPGITYVESRAMDVNGNLSASRVTEVNYDPNAISAPEITATPPSITNSGSAAFTFTGALDGTSYECSIDGATFAACTSPKSYLSLADGGHEFRVRLKSAVATGPVDSYQWQIDSSAPAPPTISSGPNLNTKLTVADFTFSGTEAALECSLDGAAFVACTSPRHVFVPNDGVHTFEVRQKTIAGTPGTSAVYSWTVDNTAPPAPVFGDGPTSPTNSTLAEVSFTGEPGGTFRCTHDPPTGANQITSCNSGTWSKTGLTEGTHTLMVEQKDDLNNQGPASTYAWTIDLSEPEPPSIGSGPPAVTSSRSATVTFTGEPGGYFECALDEASFFFCSSPRELSGLEDGEHTLRMRQIDAAGNVGGASSRSWTVDGTPPEAPALTGGPPALTNSASASFSFSGESGGSFECSLDDGPFSACTSPRNLSGLADGGHTFKVRQTDDLGNTGPTSSRSWTIDTVAPAAPTIGPQTLELSEDPNRQIGFSGEPGGFFECRINEGAWGHCLPLWNVTFPGAGTHTFDVRQTDDAGNTGPAARGSRLIWGGEPSTPVITSAPSGIVRSTSAEVQFTVGPVGEPQCNLDNVSWKPCDGVWAGENLAQGPHTLVILQRNEVPGPSVLVQWTVDTLAPKLSGKVTAKAKGKAKKGKPRTWILSSTYDRSLEKPATLEFSTAKAKPKSTAAPAKSRTRKWAAKLTIKSKPKPAWVRVIDPVGNASTWARVK